MEDPTKYINGMIILFLLLLSVKVLYDFYRRRKFYDQFIESLNGGEIHKKMLSFSENNQQNTEEERDTNKNSGAGILLKGGDSSANNFKRVNNNSIQQLHFLNSKYKRKGRGGMNNCLFDSVILSAKNVKGVDGTTNNKILLPTEDSQELRQICNQLLEKEGFPLIPDGEPAGEQYIQALSKILNCKIKIYKNHPENFIADVKHSDVVVGCRSESEGDETSETAAVNTISIVHIGPEECGHWVSLI